MNEIVEALLTFLEADLKVPRDAFLLPEEGKETDGETSWKISLKSKPEYFFWFRKYKGELLYNCNPRMKAYTWDAGRKITSERFIPELRKAFKEWFLEKDNSINILFPTDLINYPEDTTPEEKLYIYKLIKDTGANPYKNFIFFELKPKKGEDNNPWFVIQRVGKKQFFRTKWLSEPTPFNFRPGLHETETNNTEHIQATNANPIEKGRIKKIHMANLSHWINRYLSLEEAELNLRQIQLDDFAPNEIIDLTPDGSPPLTKEELKDVREMLRYWRATVDADDKVPDEKKEKFDKAVTTAELIISENKNAPKKGIGKVVGNVLKVAKDEGIRIGVHKLSENTPSWIHEHLPKLIEFFKQL